MSLLLSSLLRLDQLLEFQGFLFCFMSLLCLSALSNASVHLCMFQRYVQFPFYFYFFIFIVFVLTAGIKNKWCWMKWNEWSHLVNLWVQPWVNLFWEECWRCGPDVSNSILCWSSGEAVYTWLYVYTGFRCNSYFLSWKMSL